MSPDPADKIRADIEQTRGELGDTVEALAAKTDVKGRAKDKVEDVKARAAAKVDEVKEAAPESPEEAQQLAGQAGAYARRNPTPLAIGGGVFALVLLVRLLRS